MKLKSLLSTLLATVLVAGAQWAYAADAPGHVTPGAPVGEKDITIPAFDMTLFAVCVFVLLLLILWKFAWGPISDALKQREDNIHGAIDRAEQLHRQAEARLAEYEEKLRGSRDEVRAILDEARKDGEAVKEAKVGEAAAMIRDERDRSLREIETAKVQALKDLAERSADMAIDLAGRVIGQQLRPEDHAQLVDDAVSRFVDRIEPSKN
jgi:F-type H+-transporting ATPase subunit b